MIQILVRYNGQFGITDGETVETYAPENVSNGIIKFIVSAKTLTANGTPGRSVMYIQDLDLIGAAIIKDLQNIGFSDSTPTIALSKRHPVNTYQYIIGADMLTWYAIKVYRHDGFEVDLYSLENCTGQLTNETLLTKSVNNPILHLCKRYWDILDALISFHNGKNALTLASFAMSTWADEVNLYDRNDIYPNHYKIDCDLYSCDADTYLRNAYKGGWVYCNADTSKVYHDGITLDVNSLYPYVMLTKCFPVGKPTFWTQMPPKVWEDREKQGRAVIFYHISCKFDLKPGYLPFIQIPHDIMHHGIQETSRIESDRGLIDESIELWLTSWEFDLFKEHYNITDLIIYDGVCYQAQSGIFTNYVIKFYSLKQSARKNKDEVMTRVSKMMLNSLSGGFAKNKDRVNILLDKNGFPCGEIEVESGSKSMIPIGACITSYARCYIIRICQANYDRFLYADTDSAHLIGSDPPEGILIGDNIGHMKIERRWKRAKYYGNKIYIEEDINGTWTLTYAGVPGEVQGIIEKQLNGVTGMQKVFGGDIPDDMIDREMQKNYIPYHVEVANGTYSPVSERMTWHIDMSNKKEHKEIAKLKRIRGINSGKYDKNA